MDGKVGVWEWGWVGGLVGVRGMGRRSADLPCLIIRGVYLGDRTGGAWRVPGGPPCGISPRVRVD